jgi:hypothetical protein
VAMQVCVEDVLWSHERILGPMPKPRF